MQQEKINTIKLILESNKLLKYFVSNNNLAISAREDEFTFCLSSLEKTQDTDPIIKIMMDLNFLNDRSLINNFLHPDWITIASNNSFTKFENQIKPFSAIVAISVLGLYLSMVEEAPISSHDKIRWEDLGVLSSTCSLNSTNVIYFKKKGNWQCTKDFGELANFCFWWLSKSDFLQKISLEFYPVSEYGKKIYNDLTISNYGKSIGHLKFTPFFLHNSWCQGTTGKSSE